jgi:peptidoglycan/xylan/chitin deacetylase (PgdA/CDA1 family)
MPFRQPVALLMGDVVRCQSHQIWEWLRPLSQRQRRTMLDEMNAWAASPSDVAHTHRFLDAEGIRPLARGGLVEIGAHSLNHEMLPAHPAAFQYSEINENKAHLEGLLDHPVDAFSHPFGEYAAETVSLVREAGFSCACSVIPDVVWQDSDRFLFPRFAVNDWNGQEFKQRLEKWFGV